MRQNDAHLAAEQAEAFFRGGFNCAESVLKATADYLGIDSSLIPRVATPFGGGIARTGNACGAMTGGIMAIGMILGRDASTGDRTVSDAAAADFLQWFEEQYGTLLCSGIARVDFQNTEENAAFRAPGGRHDTVCVPLVKEAVHFLCERLAEKA